jgi:hypothetical protein
MDQSTENRPEICSALGLDCGACIHSAAASVARICHGLEARGVQQIFFQLYPSPGCQPMAQAFELAYQESSNAQRPRLSFASAAA